MYIRDLIKIKTVPFFCVLSLLLVSCNSNENHENTYEKLVKIASVEDASPIKHEQFSGVMEESDQIDLSFRVAGPIQKIYVKEGDHVTKGQLLAKMDDRDYMVQKKAIETRVEQLRAEYQRIKELHKRKSIPDNDYEKMKAGKEMAEAKLKNAIDQINDTRLCAPFSGYITKVNFEDGELVNHGTPIASLVNVSKLKVEIEVPPFMYLNRKFIKNIYCTQEDLPNEIFPLTMYANNIKANSNGLYTFYLYYTPKADSDLVPGMNVSVNVDYEIKQDTNLMKIPEVAIFEKDNETYVWVVQNNTVQAKKVKTNNVLKNGNIGIISGLNGKEKLVIGGLNLLKEGDKVRVVKPSSKTNIGNIL